MASEDSNRIRARLAINAARRGHLPKPKSNLNSASFASSSSLGSDNVFANARENSIEVYDDKFSRNSILTRSARIRKFKFYQYKPIQDTQAAQSSTNGKASQASNSDKHISNKLSTPIDQLDSSLELAHKINSDLSDDSLPERTSPSSQPTTLVPRDDIVQGRIALTCGGEPSKELNELDDQIAELEKKIADLNNDTNVGVNKLDEIFELVTKKNDLLRRQMQLNILEQERNLEKANEELTKELRSLLNIEDSRKSKLELSRQQYLYDQLLALVDKRNELVLHMDVQEKCIEDDNALKETLKSVVANSSTRGKIQGHDPSCCIQ